MSPVTRTRSHITITSPLAQAIPSNVTLNMRGTDAWRLVSALRTHGGEAEAELADTISDAMHRIDNKTLASCG